MSTATRGRSTGRGLVLLWTTTIIVSGAMLLAVAPGAMRAQADAAVRQEKLESLAKSAEELSRLRAGVGGGWGAGAEASTGNEPKLTAAVSGALAAAGLPASTLASLSPESENAEILNPGAGGAGGKGGDGGVRIALARRRATLVLTPVSLPQLGRFLSAWRDRAPQWTPVRIDLEPRQDGKAQAAPGSDLPLRVTIAIECITVQSRARNIP